MKLEQSTLQRFGIDTLRPAQQRVLDRLRAGGNVLAVMPTGGGKSLCYQLPSQELAGVTVVVSPLVSLMKDQCDALRRRGIPAARLDHTVAWQQERESLQGLRQGQIKLLYLSPERLLNERFDSLLGSTPISLLAIDEAHCVSQWGHQFRPDYLRLAEWVRSRRVGQVLALTATASRRVVDQLCRDFEIQRGDVVRAPVHRRNLHLRCTPTTSADRERLLVDRIESRPSGSTIVYVTRRRQAEMLAAHLCQAGHPAEAYHAGLPVPHRERIQADFMGNRVPIIVATVAFGMGVDKPDVRYVYHAYASSSIEAYSQEIGRGGRDGKPTICETLLVPQDRVAIANLAYGDWASDASLAMLVERLVGQPDEFDLSHGKLAWEANVRPTLVAALMTHWQSTGAVEQLLSRYNVYQVLPRLRSGEILRRCDAEIRPLAEAVLDSLAKSRRGYRLPVGVITRRHSIDRALVIATVQEMSIRGWLEVESKELLHRYRWLRRPKAGKTTVNQLKRSLRRSMQAEWRRADEWFSLLSGEGCLARGLSKHFGNRRRSPCGQCSVCMGQAGEPPRKTSSMPEESGVPEIGTSALFLLRQAVEQHPTLFSDRLARAKFLCGLHTPETTRGRLNQLAGFGVCDNVPLEAVLARVADA